MATLTAVVASVEEREGRFAAFAGGGLVVGDPYGDRHGCGGLGGAGGGVGGRKMSRNRFFGADFAADRDERS